MSKKPFTITSVLTSMQKAILRFTKGTRLAIPRKKLKSARVRTMCHNHPDRKAIAFMDSGRKAMCYTCFQHWLSEK